MTNLAHIGETALLLLTAYLLGCVLGYVARLVLHAGRGTRRLVPPPDAAVPAPEPWRPPSSAARVEELRPDAARPDMAPAPAAPQAATINLVSRVKAVGSKPPTLPQPRNGGADNLKQIKGIGPNIEASLQALGIFHIDQIAGWSQANVDWVDAQLAFNGRIRRERWVEQAVGLCGSARVALRR